MQKQRVFRKFLKKVTNLSYITRKIKYQMFYAFLEKSQWWPRWKLEQYQTKILIRLLRHAYANVPYYAELFKKLNLKPEDFNSIRDLQKLPVLSRDDVVENFDKLVSKTVNRKLLKLICTSGSTGKPMQFYRYGRELEYIDYAFYCRRLSWANLKRREMCIKLWSRPFVEGNRKEIYLYNPRLRRLSLSTVPHSLGVLSKYIDFFKKYKPVFVHGNPSMLYHLACYARENSIADIKFRSFLSAYENIFPYQRKLIEEQFNCKVYNIYNTEERVITASECSENNGLLHVEMERGILEILNDSDEVLPEGNLGRIVATGLLNYPMPLIRYEAGDIGSISTDPCPCGRGLMALKSINGRANDVLRYKGKTVYSTTMSVLIWKLKNIKECQFIQETEEEIKINIVKRADYSERDTQELIQTLKQMIDERLNIVISFMDYIPRTKMGKFPFVVSKLKLHE